MAIKRMFDKTIIELDSFADLPMTTKAIYFLLGMEADDEGFVSTKRFLRLHGGNDDDIKVLLAKKFLIEFKNGVVVITHWRLNNYLDKNRIKPTQYQEERGALSIDKFGKYIEKSMLNQSLTSVQPEEYRGEERRIEENTFSSKDLRHKIQELRKETSLKYGKIK